jgi:hypothetical protein
LRQSSVERLSELSSNSPHVPVNGSSAASEGQIVTGFQRPSITAIFGSRLFKPEIKLYTFREVGSPVDKWCVDVVAIYLCEGKDEEAQISPFTYSLPKGYPDPAATSLLDPAGGDDGIFDGKLQAGIPTSPRSSLAQSALPKSKITNRGYVLLQTIKTKMINSKQPSAEDSSKLVSR